MEPFTVEQATEYLEGQTVTLFGRSPGVFSAYVGGKHALVHAYYPHNGLISQVVRVEAISHG